MQVDRTTKVLLAALTIGVWGLLLKPVMAPRPANAEEEKADATITSYHPNGSHFFVSSDISGVFVVEDGTIYRFKGDLGKPASTASWRAPRR